MKIYSHNTSQVILVFSALFLACLFSSLIISKNRPLHHDEAINGYLFPVQVLQSGRYRYNPDNYHGPLYFYAGATALALTGESPLSIRLPSAIARATTTLLPLLILPFVSLWGILLFGLLILSSPFYSTFSGSFAIMESFLDFFILLTLMGFARFYFTKNISALWWFFMGILGMALTKETYAIFIASMGVALAGVFFIQRKQSHPVLKQLIENKFNIGVMVFTCALIYTAFYTEWFTFPKGFLNSFMSFFTWGKTASVSGGHEKSWGYFLKEIFRYEIPFVVTLCVSLALFRREKSALFFFSVALIQFVLYSVIPYKTPWCLSTVIAPFFIIPLLNIEYTREKIKQGSLLLCVTTCTVWYGYYSYQFSMHGVLQDTPFSYVHTDVRYTEFDKLLSTLSTVPAATHANGAVWIHQSYWPLPYYLRKFKRIGYFDKNHSFTFKQLTNYQLLILSPKTAAPWLDQLKGLYTTVMFYHFINDPLYFLIRNDLMVRLPDDVKPIISTP